MWAKPFFVCLFVLNQEITNTKSGMGGGEGRRRTGQEVDSGGAPTAGVGFVATHASRHVVPMLRLLFVFKKSRHLLENQERWVLSRKQHLEVRIYRPRLRSGGTEKSSRRGTRVTVTHVS